MTSMVDRVKEIKAREQERKMQSPAHLKDSDLAAMNHAARLMAWEWYNKGMLRVTEVLRDALKDEKEPPSIADLITFCEMIEAKTKEPSGL
jgi:hypothetical protein